MNTYTLALLTAGALPIAEKERLQAALRESIDHAKAAGAKVTHTGVCKMCALPIVAEGDKDPWFHQDTGDEWCEDREFFAEPKPGSDMVKPNEDTDTGNVALEVLARAAAAAEQSVEDQEGDPNASDVAQDVVASLAAAFGLDLSATAAASDGDDPLDSIADVIRASEDGRAVFLPESMLLNIREVLVRAGRL